MVPFEIDESLRLAQQETIVVFVFPLAVMESKIVMDTQTNLLF